MRTARVLSAVLLLAAPLAAQEAPRTVTVTGTGAVEVVPDVATVNYSIVNQGAPAMDAASLVDLNRKRVDPTVAYLKGVVGADGKVTAVPTIQRVEEWDQTTQKQVFKGYRVITSIQVQLCGRDNIDQNLAKLFDASKIKADDTSAPQMSLARETRKAAMLKAYQAAVTDAVDTATAELEPGEKLGKAIARGERAEVPSPRADYARMAPMAAAAPGGRSVGQAVVETGNIQVEAVINFLFEVTGQASRFLTGTDVTGQSGKDGKGGA